LVSSGTIVLMTANALGTGTTSLQGGALQTSYQATLANLLVTNGTINALSNKSALTNLSGTGALTLVSNNGGSNASSSANGFRLGSGLSFSGTLNLQSGVANTVETFAMYFNGGNFDGDSFTNATANLTNYGRISGVD